MVEESPDAVDEETLRLVQSSVERFSVVESAEFVPDETAPRRVDVTVDDHQYPTAVEPVRLEVRWFLNGDFSVHYLERNRDESTWQCRWDRHENPHNDRLHFHPPHDVSNPVDIEISPYVRDVIPTVVQWIEERIDDHWEQPGRTD